MEDDLGKEDSLDENDSKIEENNLQSSDEGISGKSPELDDIQRMTIIEEGKNRKRKVETISFVVFLVIFEFFMLVLYSTLVRNGQDVYIHKQHNITSNWENAIDGQYKNYYQGYTDVCVMIFVGFGLLMSFLKNHGYYSITMVFLISCMTMQVSILTVGYANTIPKILRGLEYDWFISLDLVLFVKALFAAAVTAISMGALIGTVTPFQLVMLVLLEIPLYSFNIGLMEGILGCVDTGRSIFVHTYGAFYGLGASFTSSHRHHHKYHYEKQSSTKYSDMFSITATVFLWIFWPSFSMCDLQNATLAGGIGIGTISNLETPIGVTFGIGLISGVISVVGYRFLTPFLKKHIRLNDTCGVLNLHGLPGIFSGVASIFVMIFPQQQKLHNFQPLVQFGTIISTLVFSLTSGLISGFLLRFLCPPTDKEDFYDDGAYFEVQDSVGLTNTSVHSFSTVTSL